MLVLIALLALALATPSSDTDWSRFRGPNGSGISETKGLPAEFGPDKNVVWKVELPQGYSSPIIHGDRIFLTGLSDENLVTIAVDRDNGKVLWETERAARPHREARQAQPSGRGVRGHRRPVRLGLLRRLRPDHLRRERQGAVEAAARPVQQHLRHGRVADHRRRQGDPGRATRAPTPSSPRGTKRPARKLWRTAATGGEERPLDADRVDAARRHARSDPAAGIVPAHRLRSRQRQAGLVGGRPLVRDEVHAGREGRHRSTSTASDRRRTIPAARSR